MPGEPVTPGQRRLGPRRGRPDHDRSPGLVRLDTAPTQGRRPPTPDSGRGRCRRYSRCWPDARGTAPAARGARCGWPPTRRRQALRGGCLGGRRDRFGEWVGLAVASGVRGNVRWSVAAEVGPQPVGCIGPSVATDDTEHLASERAAQRRCLTSSPQSVRSQRSAGGFGLR